ncbi:glutathione S-transferase L3-like protein [Tanacetum coccineum]
MDLLVSTTESRFVEKQSELIIDFLVANEQMVKDLQKAKLLSPDPSSSTCLRSLLLEKEHVVQQGLQDIIKLVPIDLAIDPHALEHDNKITGKSLDLLKYVDALFEGPQLLQMILPKESLRMSYLHTIVIFNKTMFSSFRGYTVKEVGMPCVAFDYLESLQKFECLFFLKKSILLFIKAVREECTLHTWDPVYFKSEEVKACIVTRDGLCPGSNTVIKKIVCGLNNMCDVNNILGLRLRYRLQMKNMKNFSATYLVISAPATATRHGYAVSSLMDTAYWSSE